MIGTVLDITERKQAQIALEKSYLQLKKILEGAFQAIAMMAESRDPYTAGHQWQVAKLSVAIAREMGLDENRIEGIHVGAAIHDIGKIQIPAEILAKPSQLTDLEYSLVKNHPRVGYDILKKIEFPWPVADIAYQHHERLDGSGYPLGLKGEEIILEARIVAVADVVESMANHRPYRPARGLEAAMEEIIKHRGRLFDPDVVDACVRLFRNKGFHFGSRED